MGKRSKDKVSKKERRRVEAAALARSTWLTEAAGLTSAPGGRSMAPAGLTAAPAGLTSGPASVSATASNGVTGPFTDIGSDAAPDARTTSAARPTGADLRTVEVATPPTTVDATELAARLASLSTILQRDLGRADAGDGLTRARLSALSLLVLGGPRTLGDLAAAEHVRPPTMTRLIHAMEADGLVVREPHPTDGRSIIIRATAGGEGLLGHGRAQQIASLAGAIADLDDVDRVRLADAADLLGRVLWSAGRETSDRGTVDRGASDPPT